MALPMEILDCFAILEVPPGAHPGEIRSAFRRMARVFHPDVAGPQAAGKFETIAAAYAVLKGASQAQIDEALRETKKQGPFPGKKKGGESPFRRKKKETKKEGRKEPPKGRPKEGPKNEAEKDASGERVRQLLMERAMVEAELALARLMEKMRPREGPPAPSQLARRLLGAHPGVRAMALSALDGKAENEEILEALLEMVRLWPPDDDGLERLLLLGYSREGRSRMATALAAGLPSFSELSALAFIRWVTRLPERNELLSHGLSHPSPRVLSAVLSIWSVRDRPDDLALIRLLKREEEGVLVPLLKILKFRGAPPWAGPRLAALGQRHSSSAVRVWARSIVQSGNLV